MLWFASNCGMGWWRLFGLVVVSHLNFLRNCILSGRTCTDLGHGDERGVGFDSAYKKTPRTPCSPC